ncbi:MAG: carboxypeptidase regulatory-like domain-containing protein, partial [Planctomycetes bacterium]|nr:carboxypeptidase regulatory-like domain-containing protein [Planctomycetota bacterium]
PSGAPIAGATVSHVPLDPGGPRARTDAQGRCELTCPGGEACRPLCPGVYRFEAPGYATAVRGLGEQEGPDEEVVTLLAPRELRGVVVSAAGGPLANAQVSAESETWTAEVRTEADGAFAFVDAPQGEPTVFSLRAAGHVAQVFSEADLPELVLGTGASLSGRVLDSQGRPLSGAQVRVHLANRLGDPQLLVSDANGGFVAGGLAEDEDLALEVRGGGEGAFAPWQPYTPELELRTAPLGTLVVEGCPPNVTLELAQRDVACGVARGSGPGSVAFPDLIPGAYTLTRRDSGWAVVVEVPSGAMAREPFASLETDAPPAPDLLPAGTQALRVRVVDERGAPVRWAQVSVTAGPVSAERAADDRGECQFAELPRTPATVRASAPGRVLVAPVTYDPALDGGEQVTAVLATPTELRGSIGAAARPLLRLWPAGRPELERSFEGTPDGRFRWGGLPPGTYELALSADGYVAQELTVKLPLASELTLSLEVWRGHDHEPGDGHGDEHED